MALTRDEEMILTPTYHVFDMFKRHQDATLLPLDLQCAGYEVGDEAIPALSASASQDAEGRIHLTLCSLDPSHDAQVRCLLRGAAVSELTGRVLTARTMNAHNTFERPEAVHPVRFEGARLDNGAVAIHMPPKSIVALELL
jgi:alpha-N-arabinofuranosidase